MTDHATVERLLAEMTPAEKIGQMTQVSNDSITPEEVAEYSVGSVLSGGDGNPSPNTPGAWADMVRSLAEAATESRLGTPLIYGVDAVHGHGSVRGATVFPHNVGLGAAGDPDLVARIGRATAVELAATGIHWTFAPTVAVAHDIRWGRTYESFGRDPDLVASLGAALVCGLQDGDAERPTVLGCAKHYVGDGGTSWGTARRYDWVDWWDGWGDGWQIDQGDARISEDELRAGHLPPYGAAIAAGVKTVMASYSSWNGVKLHAHRRLLTDVLKHELGFDGFVVSDWMALDQLDADYDTAVATAIDAGIDMVMVPLDFRRFVDSMTRVTASGRVSMSRIDDAVRRILRAKIAAGLMEPHRDRPPLDIVGCAEHRALAAEAVRASAVLLKNDGALPLAHEVRAVDVAGVAADDIGLQCGGWTVGWQGGTGPTTSGSTLLDGLRAVPGLEVRYDPQGRFADHPAGEVGVVCIAEPPYAEGPGDRAVPQPDETDRAVVARMRERVDRLVLVVYSGRPLVMPDLIEAADAVVAAWLPGSEAGALADVLMGERRFRATTPQPWPRDLGDLGDPRAPALFPVGHGLGLPADLGDSHAAATARAGDVEARLEGDAA